MTTRASAALVLCGAVACASMSRTNQDPIAVNWTRQNLRPALSKCSRSECRTTFGNGLGAITVTTRTREYDRREIPGWDSGSTAGRVAGSIASGMIRRAGMTTESTKIGLGSRIVSDSGDSAWTLRCSVFWIDVADVGYNRTDEDHVTAQTRTTEGIDCTSGETSDSAAARWRFRTGIAPRRDSLALVYDSLVALKSPAVSALPPMTLEHSLADTLAVRRYLVRRETKAPTLAEQLAGRVGRVYVTRETGDAIAVIHTGMQTSLDLAPGATNEEARVLRLVAAALSMPLISSQN